MGRRKITATETLDGAVYGIWERLYLAKAADLDDDEPEDIGIFNGLRDRGLDLSDVDLTRLPEWIERLRVAEDGLRFRRLQLEALQAERRCPTCGAGVAGRADRIYCSGKCRVAAHRRAEPPRHP